MIPADVTERVARELASCYGEDFDGLDEYGRGKWTDLIQKTAGAWDNALAEAWQDGHSTGRNDPYSLDANPYRSQP